MPFKLGSQSASKEQEYEALRAEYLYLKEAASRAYWSGLVQLAAVSGILVVQALTYATTEAEGVEASTFWAGFIFVVLYVLGWLIAHFGVVTTAQLERAADRLAGFIAVFHDLRISLPRNTSKLGWHVWNRYAKEKYPQADEPLELPGLLWIRVVPYYWYRYLRNPESRDQPAERVAYYQDRFF